MVVVGGASAKGTGDQGATGQRANPRILNLPGWGGRVLPRDCPHGKGQSSLGNFPRNRHSQGVKRLEGIL